MTVLPKVTTPTFAKLSYHFILKLSRAILRKSFLPLAEKSLFHAMRKIMLQLWICSELKHEVFIAIQNFSIM